MKPQQRKEIIEKAIKVFNSARTSGQMESALRYAYLANVKLWPSKVYLQRGYGSLTVETLP